MTPQPSCPSAPGSVGKRIHSGPAQGVRFEAQTPEPARRSRTCPGPGSGRATSSTRTSPGPVTTAARMVLLAAAPLIARFLGRWWTCRAVLSGPGAVSPPARRGLSFRFRLEVCEAGLEILADHAVHADEQAHHLAYEEVRAVHRPGHVGRVSARRERELGGVVGLLPTLLLPSHSYTAPCPLAGPL